MPESPQKVRDRPGPRIDPLSDVLSLLKPRSYMSGGFDMGGEWSIQFPQHKGVKCYALVSGQCWLSIDGVADPLRLESGDQWKALSSGKQFGFDASECLHHVSGSAERWYRVA